MLLEAIRKSKEEANNRMPGTTTAGSCDAEDDNNMDATPLRLIDVEATIRNRSTGGIIFTRHRSWHVISHTWSADVRNLSKIIGKRLASAARIWWPCCNDGPDLQGHRSYEQLFASTDFSRESSYKKLLEFLIVLSSDDVRWLWFDAVCINQQNKEEKEREIQQMGSYYAGSIGCHVVHHGIGRGFGLQLLRGDGGRDDAEQEKVIPRWFSRAWTFQEWILPPKTTFIIDLASEQSLARTTHAILLNEYEHQETCSCCYFETSLSPVYVRRLMIQQACNTTAAPSAGSEIREDDGDLASLPICRIRRCCRPSIHEPHFRKVPNRKSWYFADDLGFAFLIRVKLQMTKVSDASGNTGAGLTAQTQKDFALDDEEYELTRRLELKGYFRGESDYVITKEKKMRLTIEEMQVRDCSNAEDRVLSVLKLLGVEGAIQVRSNKSLMEQVIHLARTALQHRDDALVLQLCLVDGFGNETCEMSWAPHFEVKKGSWQAGARLQEISGGRFDVAADHFESFEADAQVRVLSSKGALQLAASVCAGHLVCCEHQYTASTNPRRKAEGGEPFRRMALEVDGRALIYLCARLSSAAAAVPSAVADQDEAIFRGDECAIVLEIVGDVHTSKDGSACIAFPAPTVGNMSPCDGLHLLMRERIPVWLVKMGVGMHGSAGITYFLVCIGEQELQGSVHKIGYVGISSASLQSSAELLANNNPTLCCVAGIGRRRLCEHLFRMPKERRRMCMCL